MYDVASLGRPIRCTNQEIHTFCAQHDIAGAYPMLDCTVLNLRRDEICFIYLNSIASKPKLTIYSAPNCQQLVPSLECLGHYGPDIAPIFRPSSPSFTKSMAIQDTRGFAMATSLQPRQ